MEISDQILWTQLLGMNIVNLVSPAPLIRIANQMVAIQHIEIFKTIRT